MARVYVGNLAGSVTSEDLATLFSKAGEVKGALAVSDKTSGVCRGFGFVEMIHDDEAVYAVGRLDNTELNGKRIHVESGRASEPGALSKPGRSRRQARR